jgi:hypothetical protein
MTQSDEHLLSCNIATVRNLAMVQFSDLQGKTLKRVQQIESDRIEFETDDSRTYALFHFQDCCELVEIESVTGDLTDLIGTPILMAEEATSHDSLAGYEGREPESQTWTFYKLRTIKGSVDIRWHGTSNGYYSESVDFVLYDNGDIK